MISNYAYIDGQNLKMGTIDTNPSWQIDLRRFRVYLREKYNVEKAFYYMGYVIDGAKYEKLYDVLNVMKRTYLKEPFDKIVLVSGDGDYKALVDFLIEQNKFEKILFPNKKFASSLYKQLEPKYFDYLNYPSVQHKIEYQKRRSSLGN